MKEENILTSVFNKNPSNKVLPTNELKSNSTNKNEISSSREKNEVEVTSSFPLSLEIPEVTVNLKEPQNDNFFNTSRSVTPNLNNHIFDYISGLSPFITNNVHNFTFNNCNFKGKNLFTGNKMSLNNQFSPSPLTIKVANLASMNKSIGDIDVSSQIYPYYGYGHFYPYNYFESDSNMVLSNDSNYQTWNNKIRGQNISNSPILTNRVMNLNGNTNKNDNVDLLSYLNHQNQKEIKQKENVRIKLCKNEKLIKSMFEIKEESMLSSEGENSKKYNNHIMNNNNNNINIKHEDINSNSMMIQSEDNSQSNRSFTGKYKLDGGKFLNNITYTLNNVNSDFKIYPMRDRENLGSTFYSLNNNFNYNCSNQINALNNQTNSSFNNFSGLNFDKPKIKANFIKEEQERRVSSNELNIIKEKSENAIQCNCKKSKCLKLYCECFANGDTCKNCNCLDCHNIEAFADERRETISLVKDKNPLAFGPKIDKIDINNIIHAKGCNCNKSNCQKKYCECFQSGIGCSDLCRCRDCKNSKKKTEKEEIVTTVKYNIINNDPLLFLNNDNGKNNLNLNVSESICKGVIGNNTITNNNFNIENSSICFQNIQKIKNESVVNKIRSESESKLTAKKRSRRKREESNNKTENKEGKSVTNSNNQNIAVILTKIQSNATYGSAAKALSMTTPRKYIPASLNSDSHKGSAKMKSGNRGYRDTTLSNLITTAAATTSSKRRASTKLNLKDFDSSIVKKLNMNVNNEPLFGTKNKNRIKNEISK